MQINLGKKTVYFKIVKKPYFIRTVNFLTSKSWIELGKDETLESDFYYFQLFNLIIGYRSYKPEKLQAFVDKMMDLSNKLSIDINKLNSESEKLPKGNVVPFKNPRLNK